MFKQLKSEFYRVFKSKVIMLWIIILIFLTLLVNGLTIPANFRADFGLNNRYGIGFVNGLGKNEAYHQLIDQSLFVNLGEYHIKYNKGLDELKESMGVKDHPAETPEELFYVTIPEQFVRIMWYGGGFSVMMFFLPIFLFTRDKRNDMIYIRGRLCGSFKKVALAKIIIYYIIVAFTSIISPFILIMLNIPQVWYILDTGYILRCIVLQLFMNMAVMSLSVLVAFAIDSTAIAVIANFLLALASIAANVLAARCSDILYIPFLPGVLQGMRALWQPDTPISAIAFAFCCSAAYIVICTAAACVLFDKRGRKFFAVN